LTKKDWYGGPDKTLVVAPAEPEPDDEADDDPFGDEPHECPFCDAYGCRAATTGQPADCQLNERLGYHGNEEDGGREAMLWAMEDEARAVHERSVSAAPPPRGDAVFRVVPENVWSQSVARDGFPAGAEYWHTQEQALRWADDYEATTGIACRVMGVATPAHATETDDPRGTSHSGAAVPTSQMWVVRTFDGEVVSDEQRDAPGPS
jgi:hypothetical protein